MAETIVDLADVRQEFERQAGRLWLRAMAQLTLSVKREWPKDTGKSAAAWAFDGRYLRNDVPYTEHIRHGSGVATTTVLTPLIEQAVRQTYTE